MLIFIYNADSGFMNGAFDFFHKIVRPKSYSCALCKITYSFNGMRGAWKEYLANLPFEAEFYHKDQIENVYVFPSEQVFPAVYVRSGKEMREIISAEQLESMDLPDLMKQIDQYLKSLGDL